MSAVSRVVIVGASLAGAAAAEALRAEGFDGRLTLVGEESELPYERPPLSKGYLAGASPREQVYLHGESFYAEQDIDLRLGTRGTEVDRGGGQVVLDSGERLGFDRLLLATGGAPRRLPVPGADLDGVVYLRELADADALRERFERAERVVVVGAGWIGAEVAATARQRGLDVTVVAPEPVPLARVLGPAAGEVFRALHTRHGVRLHLGATVERFEGSGRVQRVLTSEGQRLDADVVVVGIGVAPRVALAQGAGLQVQDGVVVDERLASSDPRIFAAGDVARAYHSFYGEHVRVEHWATARDQGAAAAASMLGQGRPYDALPFFFSDQYDTGLEYRGRASAGDRVVFRGDREAGSFLAFWLREGRVQAGMNLNVWDVGQDLDRLLRSGVEVDVARLADPAVPLSEVAAAPVATSGTGRRNPVAGFLAGRATFVRRFVADRFTPADPTPVEQLPPGQGRVLDVGGQKVGVYKDQGGQVHAVSPVCTHARCLVAFNPADTTWDCPCHGSRFEVTGAVRRGPAKKNLAPQQLPAAQYPTPDSP